MPWDRTSVRERAVLPNVNAGAAVNADVSNQRVSRDWAEPPRLALTPVELGRCPPPKEFDVLTAMPILRGLPLWNVETPFTPQPPSTRLTVPEELFRNLRPLPNGRS